mmetsp:Transcript_83902/g.219166  ORF Transcript_83902/g.219166 Transcript_83902/m.219166 type:complete len:229 (-) Transcript_83902:21-707(-)
MSMVPHTRSSVAPRGRSIIGTFMVESGRSSFFALRLRTSSLMTSNSVGEELYGSPATHEISGRRSTRARIVVVLPVPRSPRIMTPPILGSMTFKSRANFISACPTMAANGKTGLASSSVFTGACATAAAWRTAFCERAPPALLARRVCTPTPATTAPPAAVQPSQAAPASAVGAPSRAPRREAVPIEGSTFTTRNGPVAGAANTKTGEELTKSIPDATIYKRGARQSN